MIARAPRPGSFGPLAAANGSPGWAAMLVGRINLRNETFARALLADQSAKAIERHLRTAIGPALATLAG